MLKWRPLTQEELPDLLSGDIVQLRQNYLYNPERLPVTYVEAQCVEKRKRDGTFLLNGSDIPISISLTEAGRVCVDWLDRIMNELDVVRVKSTVRVEGLFHGVKFKSKQIGRERLSLMLILRHRRWNLRATGTNHFW
jgi:hypothetical protein